MKGLHVFDNSTNHVCLPENTIHRGTDVNKRPGGPMTPGLTVTDEMTGKLITENEMGGKLASQTVLDNVENTTV